jgi:hypothetical protein
MVHEVSNQTGLLEEIKSILRPKGQFLIVEPKIHVSKRAFDETIMKAMKIGFEPIEQPKIFFSRSMILGRG